MPHAVLLHQYTDIVIIFLNMVRFLKTIDSIEKAEHLLRNKKAALIIISAISLLAYANSFNVPFILDDFGSIANNYSIRNPFDIFSMWKFYSNRIVVYFSFALGYAVHNTYFFGYHIMNLLIHISNGLLVFLLIRNLLGVDYFKKKSISRYKNIVSLICAVVFVCHPIQVNAVTYIVQRTASLASTFYFLSALYFLKFRMSGRWRYFALTMVFTITAMFTKENTITIPFLLLLIEIFFFIRDKKTRWWKRLVFILAISLTIMIIPGTNLVLKGHSQSDPGVKFKASTSMDRMQYFYTQQNVLTTYIKLLFIPDKQNFDYSNDFPFSKSIWENHSYLSALILLLIILSGLLAIKNNRLISFGIFWFFIAISVESSFISIKDVYFEHRLYMPLPGFVMALAGIAFISFTRKKRKRFLLKEPLLYFIITACFMTVFYASLTIKRNYVYSNGVRLWSDTVKMAPDSDRAHSCLASGYMDTYESDKSRYPDHIGLAEQEFKKAIELNYRNSTAHCNLSRLYLLCGKYEKCIDEANITLSMSRSKYAYHNLGSAHLNMKNYKEAEQAFLGGYGVDNRCSFILKDLGNIYFETGDYDKSIKYYQEFLENSSGSENKAVEEKISKINNIITSNHVRKSFHGSLIN